MSKMPLVSIHKCWGKIILSKLAQFEKILSFNNIPCQFVDSSEPDFWEKISSTDIFIYNFVHLDSEMQNAKAILPIIENQLHISCFPDFNTRWHYDDKIRQTHLFEASGLPMAESWVFWNLLDALNWIETAEYPVVFKLKGGAGSANVILISNKQEASRIAKIMFSKGGVSFSRIPHRNNLSHLRDIFKLYGIRRYIADKRGRLGPNGPNPYWQSHRDYILFQKFFPNNTHDQRVTVIGDKAFTFIRYTRPNDFRASGSGLIDYDMEKCSMECVEIAFTVSRKLKFQCMAYDFVFDEMGKAHIIEISYTFVDSAVRNCPGYFDESLNWHEGHFWPQFSILDMLLPEHNLRQPPDAEM